jgi:hypothetical protein
MVKKLNSNEELPEYHDYVPEELLLCLYETLQKSEKYVMDEMHLYILSQILTEQMRRYIHQPRKSGKPEILVLH